MKTANIQQLADSALCAAYGVDNPDVVGFMAFNVEIQRNVKQADMFCDVCGARERHCLECGVIYCPHCYDKCPDCGSKPVLRDIDLWRCVQRHDSTSREETTQYRQHRENENTRICDDCGKRVVLLPDGTIEKHTQMPIWERDHIRYRGLCLSSGLNGENLPIAPSQSKRRRNCEF